MDVGERNGSFCGGGGVAGVGVCESHGCDEGAADSLHGVAQQEEIDIEHIWIIRCNDVENLAKKGA